MQYHTICFYLWSQVGWARVRKKIVREELIMREKEELEDAPVHATWVQLTAIFGSSQSTTMSF